MRRRTGSAGAGRSRRHHELRPLRSRASGTSSRRLAPVRTKSNVPFAVTAEVTSYSTHVAVPRRGCRAPAGRRGRLFQVTPARSTRRSSGRRRGRRRSGYSRTPVFHAVRAPTAGELQVLLTRIIKRLMRLLTRKGYLIEEQGMTYLGEIDPDTALGPYGRQHAPTASRSASGGPESAELANPPDRAATDPRGLRQRAGLQPPCRGVLRRQ